MREYELRVAQKMSMKVSDLFLNNSERNTVSAKVLAAWLEIKPNRPPLYPFTMSTIYRYLGLAWGENDENRVYKHLKQFDLLK